MSTEPDALKRRILDDITAQSRTLDRGEARLTTLFADARRADISLRDIAAATEGRATHQTIANRLAAAQNQGAVMTTATDTFRRPTAKQLDALRKVAADTPIPVAIEAKLTERGWLYDDDGQPELTEYGQRMLDDGTALERLAAVPYADRPDRVRLQRRMSGRSWLGWEVKCYAGCKGGVYGTPRAVWATNDHTARDKYRAEVAYAWHILGHLSGDLPEADQS